MDTQKIKNRVLESPSRFWILILNGAQNFKFIGSDWLNLIHIIYNWLVSNKEREKIMH